MPLYQVVVLALIQALTEFLPISSSAHLALAPWLFGWKDPGLTFDIALHAGTLVAIVLYFFKDWVQIIAQGFGLNLGHDPELKRNRSLLWLIAAASVPVGVMGWLFGKQAESTWRNPYVIGGMLIGVGLLMWQAERLTYGKKDLGHVTGVDAFTIGLSQALAVIPGTSRSGITITTGLFRNLNRETAARFSFLLSAPAIAAAAAKKAWDIHKHGGIAPDMRMPFAVGVVVSAVAGAVGIAFFLRYLLKNSLIPFVYYRLSFCIMLIAPAVLC